MKKQDDIECPICKRDVPPEYQEKHHLVPKAKKGKETVIVCCSCGDQLHQIFTNKELTKQYNTVAKILANDKIQKWVKWIQKRPDHYSVCMARKKKR